ncbi:MAG: cytochrome b5 domain-containing protein [bacterium]|nr:cytochrome b5 domain-containing protein [bacterium]
MKVVIGIVIASIAISGLVVIFIANKDDSSNITPVVSMQTDESTENPQDAVLITAQEVAKHNEQGDCWAIIAGSVYDLTSFISGHPGGSEILRACGNDATTLFQQRETAEGQSVESGTSHSSTAEGILNGLKLGDLKN